MARILFIEDGEVFRNLVSEALKRAGFEVQTAGDGEAGWSQLDTAKPDLIILDMAMPKLDGLSFLRRLRGNDKWSLVPVLVVSAHNAAAENAVRLGAQGYLLKSRFSMPELIETVQRLTAQVLRRSA